MSRKAKWVGVSWMAVALLPVLIGAALAVDATSPRTDRPIPHHDESIAPMPGPMREFQPNLERAKDLLGARVLNDQDERLGTIYDIVLTPNHDAISYVVLSHGGFWGIGDTLIAVPWAHFSFRAPETPEDASIPILSGVTPADLERAPGLERNNWPATAREDWLGTEYAADGAADRNRDGAFDRADNVNGAPYGGGVARSGAKERTYTAPGAREPVVTEPRADGTTTAPGVTPEPGIAADPDRLNNVEQRRLSRLLNMSVRNFQDENLGRLDNAIIDVNRGQVAYGILSMRTGFLGLSRRYVAVPWSSLDFLSQPGLARLDVDPQTLTAMAVDEDEFPNLEDMQYSRQLHAQFNATPYWEVLGFVPGDDR